MVFDYMRFRRGDFRKKGGRWIGCGKEKNIFIVLWVVGKKISILIGF